MMHHVASRGSASQPGGSVRPCRAQHAVEQAVGGLVHPAPDEADDDRCDDVGRVERGFDALGPRDVPVQHHCQRQAHDHGDGDEGDDPLCVVGDRDPEDPVVEEAGVVPHADDLRRRNAIPVGEAEIEGIDHRADDPDAGTSPAEWRETRRAPTRPCYAPAAHALASAAPLAGITGVTAIVHLPAWGYPQTTPNRTQIELIRLVHSIYL